MFAIKKGIHHIPETIMLLIILTAAFFGFYGILDTQLVIEGALSERYAEYKPGFDEKEFAELKKNNPEVVGWIDIYGTPIDYPITHTDDNSKYLGLDAFGESATTGSIFLDARNKADFSDNIQILWGHNMTPQVMFGSIRDFMHKQYFDERKYGDIYYGGRHHGIVIYGAVTHTFTSDAGVYSPGHFEDSYVKNFMEGLLDRSIQKRKADISKIDNVLLLSTCAADLTEGKNVLVCTITDKTYEDSFDIDKSGIDLLDIYSRLPLLLWLIFAFLLLILIHLLLKTYKERKERKLRSKARRMKEN